jgi:3-oxoacyl-[acyl-carrier protein] reductase
MAMSSLEVPALSFPRIALVTGGGSGIGRATAARLAALGSAVIVGYNSRREQAEAVAAELPGEGHLCLRISVEDTASIAEAAAAVEARFGRLDALINCGGATVPVPAQDLDGLTDSILTGLWPSTCAAPSPWCARSARCWSAAAARPW